MKIKFTLIGLLLLITANIFAEGVTIEAARRAAQNLYFEKSGVKQTEIFFSEEKTISQENTPMYYVFNMGNDKGFVIVSADDVIQPILGYSTTGVFETENQPISVSGWMKHYEELITYLIQNNVAPDAQAISEWNKYLADSKSFVPSKTVKAVQPLTADIKWDQGTPWNNFCPPCTSTEPGECPGGHVYAGCVATAMSIIMKYWNYPSKGTGSHSYYASSYDYTTGITYNYGTLTADFGATDYYFGYMNNTVANEYSERLMYHCGIAVNMGYQPNGSGAQSLRVPEALSSHFGYPNTTMRNKDTYSGSWNNLLKGDLDLGRPIYYSGRDVNDGGHAFVCDGYDDASVNNYFHFNFGWGGSSNGYFYIDGPNVDFEYATSQGCITGIIPEVIYPNAPASLNLSLSPTTLHNVDLTWEAPAAGKDLLSYNIYREQQLIATDIPTIQQAFTDENVPVGIYHYGVEAVYSTGNSVMASGEIEVKDNFSITFTLKKPNGGVFYPADITFNGITKAVNFGGIYVFTNVNFGDNQAYTITPKGVNASYPPVLGNLNVYQDETITKVFSLTNINDLNQAIDIYPNPSQGIFNIETENQIVKVDVYNIAGQLVYKAQDSKTIDISSQSSGIYFVNIITNEGSVLKKIIKN